MDRKDALHLRLEAEPESIRLARLALRELAEKLGIEEPARSDVLTIVSEASGNVVRHAYPKGEGAFEVQAYPLEGQLTIIVRDFGVGMRPAVQTEESSLRIGLGLISTLSARFEIIGNGEGTEIRAHVSIAG